MALITLPFTFSAGAVIIASQHNSNFTTISSDYNGNIDNTNIVAGAGITYSKLTLTGGIVNADINASAAIAASKLSLVSPGAIGSTTPNTGAFTTLKVGTANQGDILYDNGTSLVRLTPGTSGQALITGGASANPAWGTGGSLTLISKTTVTAAATTGNIAITQSNSYLVIVVADDVSGGTNTIGIRANGDTGSNYYSGYSGRGASAAIGASSSGATSIVPGTGVVANLGFFMQFNINSSALNTSSANFYGNLCSQLITGGIGTVSTFGGFWSGGALFTSFLVLGSGNWTGNVYLYKYALS